MLLSSCKTLPCPDHDKKPPSALGRELVLTWYHPDSPGRLGYWHRAQASLLKSAMAAAGCSPLTPESAPPPYRAGNAHAYSSGSKAVLQDHLPKAARTGLHLTRLSEASVTLVLIPSWKVISYNYSQYSEKALPCQGFHLPLGGTLSTPPGCRGWHLQIRTTVSAVPFNAPCTSSASRAYCEHVG